MNIAEVKAKLSAHRTALCALPTILGYQQRMVFWERLHAAYRVRPNSTHERKNSEGGLTLLIYLHQTPAFRRLFAVQTPIFWFLHVLSTQTSLGDFK